MCDQTLLCRRLSQLLLLDTEAASERDVFEHLERYDEALQRTGESVRLRAPVRLLAAADVCAALVAMPDDLQLKILDHLSDYEIVALLACRKTPCFSESTCYELLETIPSTACRRLAVGERAPKGCGAFDAPRHELCPFREFRRRSYQRGVTHKYAIATDFANRATPLQYTLWSSLDVPGDTVKLEEVVTRLVPPSFTYASEPAYLREVHFRETQRDAKRIWWDNKPRWFPPLARLTDQGNVTDGRVGQFLRMCS